MKSALSAKAAAGEIIVVDSIKLDSIKTKDFRAFLTPSRPTASPCGHSRQGRDRRQERPQYPRRRDHHANLMNVYDILKAKYLVLDKEALAVIEEVFA